MEIGGEELKVRGEEVEIGEEELELDVEELQLGWNEVELGKFLAEEEPQPGSILQPNCVCQCTCSITNIIFFFTIAVLFISLFILLKKVEMI